MSSFIRPFLPAAWLATGGAVVLIMAAVWIPTDRLPTVDRDSARVRLASDWFNGQAQRLADAAVRRQPSGFERARFGSDGSLTDWTDAFRPADWRDEVLPAGATLTIISNNDALRIQAGVNEPDGSRFVLQSLPLPALDGPFRMFATPYPDVMLYMDQPEYLEPSVTKSLVQLEGTDVGWMIRDRSGDGASRANADFWRIVWLTSWLLLYWQTGRLIRQGLPSGWKPVVTYVQLLLLPELLLRTGWLDGAFALVAVPVATPELWGLWIRGLCYAVPAAIHVRTLLRFKRLYGLTWYPRTVAFSIVFGLAAAPLLLALIGTLYQVASSGDFQVLGIDALPSLNTLWLYTGSALLSASVLSVVFITAWFLMNSESDQLPLVHACSVAGVLTVPIGVALKTGVWSDPLLWAAVATAAFLYAAAYWMHRQPDVFRSMSPFRQILMGVLALSIHLYPILYLSNQAMYAQRAAQVAEQTARLGIGTDREIGLESPYRITLYEDTLRVDNVGDYIPGQFTDRASLLTDYRNMGSNEVRGRTIEGPLFRYRETAVRIGSRTAVVGVRTQNAYNHLFAFFRLAFIILGGGLVAYPLIRYATGNRVDLFRGRERFEYRVLDTYMITSFVFLLLLTILTRQIILSQNANKVQLDLTSRLDAFTELADDIDRLSSLAARTETDFFVYEGRYLRDFTESFSMSATSPNPLLPKAVWTLLFESGQDRAVHRFDDGSGDVLIAFRRIGTEQVLAIPANLSANKYMDEILQTTSLSIIMYLVIFGLFIGGAVLITRELMQPIHQFRKGLQRIAAGQLDTLIPVTSRDEIGELAHAYNLMVYKLKDLQDELADKERQTAWAEMARQVAHEIKNPLTPMKLSVQHLYQQVHYGEKPPSDIKDMVGRISETLIREIDSLNNIANDFSKFARPIVDDFVETDVNETIRSIVQLYQHDNRLYLWTDLDERPLRVSAVPDELKRVFLNLVKNAMEATSKGGLVVIRTTTYGDHAWIEVVDNGSGIPLDLKSRIFIPNFSTKSTGTGLGLAICKKVILAHKGQIEFSSTPGMGTTFTIRLPLCAST